MAVDGRRKWICRSCGFDNFATRVACYKCGAEPAPQTGGRAPRRGAPPQGQGRAGTSGKPARPGGSYAEAVRSGSRAAAALSDKERKDAIREGRRELLEEQRKRQEAGEDAAVIIAAKPAQPAQREPPKPPTNGAAADGRVRNAEEKLGKAKTRLEAAEAEKEKADAALVEAKKAHAEAETRLQQAKAAKANFYAQQVVQQRPPLAELLPSYARENKELQDLLAQAETVLAKIPPPPPPAAEGGADAAAAVAAPAEGGQMDCDEDGASDIFQEEAAAFLMGGNEAMDASVAKRTASDLLGHLQRSKKLRLVQPAQAGR